MAWWVSGWVLAGAITAGVSVSNSSANVAKKQQQSLEDSNKASLAALKDLQPSAKNAEEEAGRSVEQKRRMRALAGGKTLLTKETLGSSSTTAPKSLLGA